MVKNKPLRELRVDRVDDFHHYDMRNARLGRNLTYKQLSEITGIPMPSLVSYETLRSFPNPLRARRIANALKADVNYFFPKEYQEIVSEIRKERSGISKDPIDSAVSLDSLAESETPTIVNDTVITRAQLSELKGRMTDVLKSLTQRENNLIRLSYGLDDVYVYRLEELGQIFKVTKERARQIEARGMKKLQRPLIAKHLENF
jgi:RNA polymerase sigma factor (sigma-70 family)